MLIAKNMKKRTSFVLLYIICFLAFWGTACSHKTAYVRPDAVQAPHTVDVKTIKQRILLIGDAGIPQAAEPVLQLMEQWASEIPHKTYNIFLGDNIYPNGIPNTGDPFRAEAERRLHAQIAVIANSGSQGVFIPGNHDWAEEQPGGLQRLKHQEDLVTAALGKRSFIPRRGCPGPERVDLDGVRIIILDTHWWLTRAAKPSAVCPFGDEDAILAQLAQLLSTAGEREVMIAVHHPWATHGRHGGFFSWKDHLFPLTNVVDWLYLPLPVVGSLYPFIRWNMINRNQDLNGTKNQEMRTKLGDVLINHPPLIYVSGHEHSLEVLDGSGGPQFVLVSGAGAQEKISGVGHGQDTIFAHEHSGFMAVDWLNNGAILLRVVEPADNEVAFAKWLKKNK